MVENRDETGALSWHAGLSTSSIRDIKRILKKNGLKVIPWNESLILAS